MYRGHQYFNGTVSVSLVKQYTYCPAIPWINWHLNLYEDPTPSMETGRMVAGEKEEVAKRLGLPEPWRFEVKVVDRRLNLSGVIDIVAGKRRLTIVEVKRYRRSVKVSQHFKDQLMLYALLANNNIAPVREAILVLGDRAHRYMVTRRDLERAKALVEKTRKIIQSEEPPRPRMPGRKCDYCWYRRVCPSHP
ncbi:MAG: CRISPR-associated protein Cas4 [Desulfurococcales archaeon]|nr:CRISPR-associated protein Cas4 [Desulfurococcales archaeon]